MSDFLSKNKIWLAAILFLIGGFLYIFNLHNPLFWDDADWIVNNPAVHALSWANLKFIFSHDTLAGIGLRSNYFRPFLFITFLFNYIFSGTNPGFYHLTSNLIHLANGLLIFFLLDKFLKKRLAAFLAALLFLIHPLQTEAVTYISGRGDPLSVLLMLLALWFFVEANYEEKQIRGGGGTVFESVRVKNFVPRSLSQYVLSLFLASLAILSRETAFLFPLYLTVFLTAFIYKDKFWTSLRQALLSSWPFFLISLIYGLLRLTVLNFQNTLNFFNKVSNAYTEHLIYRIYTFFHVLIVYLRLIFWPTGLHMERDLLVNTSLWQWPVWLGALLLLGIIILGVYFYKRKKNWEIWFFAWGFFFINLAPTSGVFPINALLYEHWLYFSLFGFFALAGIYLEKWLSFLKLHCRPFFYFSVLVLVGYFTFFSVQTVRRNLIWGKTEEFYNNILQHEPSNIRILNNLSNLYADQGKLDQAEKLLWRAVEANDIQAQPYYNLGNLMRDKGDKAAAIELYKKAIQVDSSFYYAYQNLAAIYAEQGNLSGTLGLLQSLSQLRPFDPLVWYNLGKVENALGQKVKAKADVAKALQIIGSQDYPYKTEMQKFYQSLNNK